MQNGADSDTIIDAVSLTGVGPGSLAAGTALQLTGAGAAFVAGPGSQTLASLAGAANTQVLLTNTALIISSNDPVAIFAGNIAGTGSVTVNGTLRLVGNAQISFSGGFTNNGVLDIMTWNGALPAGFVNQGVVLDRSRVVIRFLANTNGQWAVSIDGYTGHNYQLQRCDQLGGGWVNIGANQAGSGGTLQLADAINPAGASGFYRVLVNP